MSLPAQPAPAPRFVMSGAWARLLLGSLLLVMGAETLLLGAGTGFLTSGFNTGRIDSPLLWGVFLVAGAAMDLALLLAIWTLVVPIASRLRLSPAQVFCCAGLAGTGIPVLIAAARYNVYSVVGAMFSVALASQSSQLSSSSMAAQFPWQGGILGISVALWLGVSLLLLIAARRLERRRPELREALLRPPTRFLGQGSAIFACCGALLLSAASPFAARLAYGFDRKTSAILIRKVVETLSDVDRDGYGLLSRPPDPSAFDAAIHPYAPEQPGNGIDENGLAGDLPAERAAAARPALELPLQGAARPHFLLVYLESFRADLLEERFQGREITPFLNELARQGASSRRAYAHSPWTLASRAQLFGGRLSNSPGQATLIDDFSSLGYSVGHFSGQDESYGDSVSVLGTGRADAFYDARGDVDRRTSRSTEPVSLQVSWKTLLSRVEDYLEQLDPRTPAFLYVNVVDTHYPYFHDELDAIFDVEPLDRAQIRSHRARQVWETYLNTAANVDRAVQRVVGAFRRRIGGADHAILITADHGQSFYEQGLLGHGQTLDDAQTRVPFILWGIGGRWPEPIAPSDVRGLLRQHLGRGRDGATPRARFVPEPERRLLQYVPGIEQPRRIGLRGVELLDEYDFSERSFRRLGGDATALDLSPALRSSALQELVWRWEAEQRAAVLAQSGDD